MKILGGGYSVLDKSYSNSVCYRWFKRTKLILNHITFDETMKYAEDTLFLARFRPICDSTLLVRTHIYYYYQRRNSSMHDIDVIQHTICMLKLAKIYKSNFFHSEEIKKRLDNAYIRTMQAFCADLCLYCSNKSIIKEILQLLKINGYYPFGIDKGNFRIDKRQSRKSDLMNWVFGLLSVEPYFWICWKACSLIRKRSTEARFEIDDFAEILKTQ